MQKVVIYVCSCIDSNASEINKYLESGWEVKKIVPSHTKENAYFCFLLEKTERPNWSNVAYVHNPIKEKGDLNIDV